MAVPSRLEVLVLFLLFARFALSLALKTFLLLFSTVPELALSLSRQEQLILQQLA